MPVTAIQYRQLESNSIRTAEYQNPEFTIKEIQYHFMVRGANNLHIPLPNICPSRLRQLSLDVHKQIPYIQVVYKVIYASWMLQQDPVKVTFQRIENKEYIGDPSEKQLTLSSSSLTPHPLAKMLSYKYLGEFVKDVKTSLEYPQIDLNNFQWKIFIHENSTEVLTFVAETLTERGFKVKIDPPHFTLGDESDTALARELTSQQYICVSIPPNPVRSLSDQGNRYKNVPFAYQVLEQSKARKEPQKQKALKPQKLKDVFALLEKQLKYIAEQTPLIRRWGFYVSMLTPQDREELVKKITSLGFTAELDLPTILDGGFSQSIMISLPEESDKKTSENKED